MSELLNLDDAESALRSLGVRLSALEKDQAAMLACLGSHLTRLSVLEERADRLTELLSETVQAGIDLEARLPPTAAGEPGTGSTTTPTCGHIGSGVRLDECPVGLFWWGDTLVLKTEYGTNEGRIDAYIVSSGEMFWGPPPQTIESQRVCMVIPVDTDFVEKVLAPTCGSTGDGSGISEPLVFAALCAMTDEQRLDMFARFCTHCGSLDPSCQCWDCE